MIRPAVAEDAAAIGELHNRTWWRAYQDVIDPAALAERVAQDQTELWRTLIADAGTDVFAFELEGTVRGVVSVCAARSGEGADWGEVAALYVEPAAQGAGVGGTLLEQGLQRLRERGFARAMLWTFRDNAHSRVFYEARGWVVEEGSERDNPEHWLAPAVRYRRDPL